ncbi:MAG: thiol-disulfide isomerase [Ignavibacteria bacterium CG22_combo_CG10-13_8_21_14_all_37_15]|nr:MAG: thiol-disulfide isomerase [Ignavibacteria bacterium CG22_combo_CG10-13_8_21_14_all_37_15]
MKRIVELALVVILILSFSITAQKKEREKFDPLHDAAKDIKNAVVQATKENKRILLDVGGEWCIWCHRLDEFILADKEIDSTLHANFIVVKVNYSKENKNEALLSKYPKVEGYPHFFILEKDGKLLLSKNTGELEAEKSYSREKLLSFFKEWKRG